MDFEALIGQIGDLERINRDEERKLIEEKQRHDSTKRELDKGTSRLINNSYTNSLYSFDGAQEPERERSLAARASHCPNDGERNGVQDRSSA